MKLIWWNISHFLLLMMTVMMISMIDKHSVYLPHLSSDNHFLQRQGGHKIKEIKDQKEGGIEASSSDGKEMIEKDR